MAKYRIWAIDCDGPGDVRYAPLCDTREEAQAWIDDWTKDMDGGDITRVWIEEEDDEDDDPTPYYGFDNEPMTMGMSEHDERL